MSEAILARLTLGVDAHGHLFVERAFVDTPQLRQELTTYLEDTEDAHYLTSVIDAVQDDMDILVEDLVDRLDDRIEVDVYETDISNEWEH